MMKSYQTAGEEAAEGFQTGIKDNADKVADQAESMANDTVKATEEALDIHSPSKVYQRIGENIDQGLIQGIGNHRQQVINTLNILCSTIIANGRSQISTSTWEEIGRRIPEGMTQGINNGSSSVVSAVERLARNAVEAARRELDIHSPSKKFEYMGEMSGEGYIEGWKETMADIDNVIAMSLPSASILADQPQTVTNNSEKRIEINNEINFYTPTDDPIETARRIKESQQEAAQEW